MMTRRRAIRIATRRSALALWQAGEVARALEGAGAATEVLGMATQGDRDKAAPLHSLGGKGVFVKELETALLEGRADVAVHSMKDLPAVLPPGLSVRGMLARADPRDALVSGRYGSLAELPAGARLGSSSLRRRYQLLAARPGLAFHDLRGNVETRLARLDAGDFDGIILAAAGLTRLGLAARIAERLPPSVCLPAAGQGAIGVEAREGDARLTDLLEAISHPPTMRCVLAERAVTAALEATCNLPIATYAEEQAGGRMFIRAYVASSSGAESLSNSITGAAASAEQLGAALAQKLLDAGATRLLADENQP